jgi:hypothetical protein
MDNFLIPFDAQVGLRPMQTTEAIWNLSSTDALDRFRMTRRGWGEWIGAKRPQAYIDILKHRYPLLPEGTTFAVKAVDGKERTVFTLSVIEFFRYACKSDLPKAKHFVYHFPDFLLALQKGGIKPPPINGCEPLLLEHPTIPKGQKKDHIRIVCESLGWTVSKYYRELKRVERIMQVNLKPTRYGGKRKPDKRLLLRKSLSFNIWPQKSKVI